MAWSTSAVGLGQGRLAVGGGVGGGAEVGVVVSGLGGGRQLAPAQAGVLGRVAQPVLHVRHPVLAPPRPLRSLHPLLGPLLPRPGTNQR